MGHDNGSVNRLVLPNGLRIVHSHVPVTAMAAVNVLYATGSRDEDPELTGLAHLFEHLMFGGSANVADFSRAVEDAGGADNAWTDTDFTNFYTVLPAVNIETAFYLESDRMLAPALSERTLQVQKSVVIEEFKQQCLNRPYGDLGHELRKALYGSHPYGWPVIGKTPDHVAKATLDDVRRYFYSHYGPDNAVLSVAGNVDFDTVVTLARKWFGDIPRRGIQRRDPQPPARLAAPVTIAMSGDVSATMVTMAWQMGRYGTVGYYTADLITDLLAADRAGRFYRRLLMGTDLFTEVDASISGSELEGYLMVNFKSRDDSDEGIERCRQAVLAQLRALAGPGDAPTEAELQRVKTRYEASQTFAMMNYVNKAQTIGREEMAGLCPGESLERYRSVTADDVMRVARSMFVEGNCVTVVYRPKNSK